MVEYIVRLVRSTRESADLASGASPRAAVLLANAARARAALAGRDYVLPDDIKFLVQPVYRHRIMLRPEAEIEGLSPDGAVDRILSRGEVPR